MNRDTLRSIKALPMRQFEQVINEVLDEQIEKRAASKVNLFLVSFFLAFCDRYPEQAQADILHSIAVDTIEYTNGIEPASELIEVLKQRTGFDVYEPTKLSSLNYIPKGETTSENHAG